MNRKEKALEFANQTWDIRITGRHIDVTEPMKEYALEKISKIEKFIDKLINVSIVMEAQKLDHHVYIVLKFGGMKITSSASCTDMYASIDKAIHKLEAQLRRYKSKIQDHHIRHHSPVDMNVNILKLDEDNSDNQETQEFQPHTILKQKTLPLKTLTYDEAVMKMELSNDGFLVFMNEADKKINVIYRRKDENYGVIEPQY